MLNSALFSKVIWPGYWCYAKLFTLILRGISKLPSYQFPQTIRIESTNRCNANCTTCTREKLTRPLGTMDFDLFKKIVDECAANNIRILHLHNFGEPLLDSLLSERVKYAKSKGIRTRIFSNFSALTREKALQLLDAGIDEIKISIDAASKETYEAIRKNLKFAQVEANLEMMLQLRAEQKLEKPRISLVFVATDNNRHEVKKFKQRWQHKVDKIFITSYHNWAGGLDKGGAVRKRLLPCLRLWKTFTILWDGRAALCCLDFNGQVILGDLNKQTIQEIYSGQMLSRIREQHLRWQYNKIPICLNCEGRK